MLGFHLKLHPGIWYTHAGGSICYPPVLIGHRYSASSNKTNITSECDIQSTVHGGDSYTTNFRFISVDPFIFLSYLLVPFISTQYSALHCTTLHCTALHCTTLHCTALHCSALHYTTLHCSALHCSALHYTALHCSALQRTHYE